MTADPAALDKLASAALAEAAARRRVPGATYRFQFRREFTLRDALALVPYLDALGVTHVYASPVLKARPGSPHGYDVVDPGRLNPDLGTEDDLRALAAALRARGMGLVLDTVPNHMCIGADNPWWADVLEHGPSSPYADYFDIAWHDSPRPGMNGRLLLPVLGDQYGAVLEGGQFRVAFEGGAFSVWYYDTRLPVDPRTYGRVLGPAAADLAVRLGVEHPDAIELTSILNAVEHLPPRGEPDPTRVAMGRVETAAVKRRLGELAERFPAAASAIAAAVGKVSGTPGDPASFAALDDWLEAQAYRPCFWRVASDEINYRRFFDVNELAAVGTEREDVFRAVHRLILGWLAEGVADGLRIDHPDGLFDPKSYLDRLQAHYVLAVARRLAAAAPDEFPGIDPDRDEAALLERLTEPAAKARPLYVVVEKILADAEELPAEWACDGTTGYEFITAVNNLFVDPAGEPGLTRFYREFTGQTDPFPTLAYEKKDQILSSSLSSELTALSHQLDRLARLDRRSRDFTLNGIRRGLREVIASFPVYRSYVNGVVRDIDKGLIGRAVSKARRQNAMLGRPLFDFIRDTLLLKDPPSGPASDEYRALQRRFAGKFQQLTAPVTAKGVEDTAFYVFNRLVSLNEVGGEPGHFGWPPERAHAFFLDRQEDSPGSLSPLSTHDTKRSEDARARLNALSELPGEWADRVARWAHLNARHREEWDDGHAPDRNEEYLIYQTLVAVWDGGPDEAFKERVGAFTKKALCEAKVHSSWINPDPDYEAAVERFLDRVLDPAEAGEFLADLAAFATRVGQLGRVTGLAQTVIRCTAPGVPDTYQGTECWDFSLVDPDNRRAVDYAARQAWLKEVDSADPVALAADLSDPRVKLFTVARLLRARRDHTALFAHGEYMPLSVQGAKADHVFAFARRCGAAAAVVVVPRLAAAVTGAGGWGDTVVSLYDLPAGRWADVFTGAAHDADLRLPVADVLGLFPVAVLFLTPNP
ncbi:malto-oligosyltrehalose synthase [bacterium]|nr:malto-oligosyltrehalose synthase [bacterium]